MRPLEMGKQMASRPVYFVKGLDVAFWPISAPRFTLPTTVRVRREQTSVTTDRPWHGTQ